MVHHGLAGRGHGMRDRRAGAQALEEFLAEQHAARSGDGDRRDHHLGDALLGQVGGE